MTQLKLITNSSLTLCLPSTLHGQTLRSQRCNWPRSTLILPPNTVHFITIITEFSRRSWDISMCYDYYTLFYTETTPETDEIDSNEMGPPKRSYLNYCPTPKLLQCSLVTPLACRQLLLPRPPTATVAAIALESTTSRPL